MEMHKSYALYYKRPFSKAEWFTGYFEEPEEKAIDRAVNLKDKGFQVRVVEQTTITRTIRAFE